MNQRSRIEAHRHLNGTRLDLLLKSLLKTITLLISQESILISFQVTLAIKRSWQFFVANGLAFACAVYFYFRHMDHCEHGSELFNYLQGLL